MLNIGAHVLCSCVSSRVIVHNGHCAFKLALGHASYKTIAVNSFQFERLFFKKKSINIKVIILNEPKTNCDQKSSQGVFVKASSLLSSSPRKITITIMITMETHLNIFCCNPAGCRWEGKSWQSERIFIGWDFRFDDIL